MKAPTQKMCDSLITPIVKKERPYCEACGHATEVGHHFIEKSRSSFLRYNIDDNIIALCNSCHAKIHNRFGNSVMGSYDVATIIINNRGKKWLNKLKKDGQTYNKVNAEFYKRNYELLKSRYES